MSLYDDIFMRDHEQDDGRYPSSPRLASSNSPDIVPAGTSPLKEAPRRLRDKYFDGPYQLHRDLALGQYNYIYVRGKNLSPHNVGGEVYLYYTPSSLLLQPSRWSQNRIGNSNNSRHARVEGEAGKVVVGDAPFYWSPERPPHDQHYCLVAQVVTERHPNPIPPDQELRDFSRWVRERPGIAWHNVQIIDTGSRPDFQTSLAVANPNPDEERVVISARCKKIPVGTRVSLRIPVDGPRPRVDASASITDPELQFVTAQSLLPARFENRVFLAVTLPRGQRPGPGAEIEVSYHLLDTEDSPVADLSVAPESLGLAEADLEDSRRRAVRLGDFVFKLN